MPHFNSGRLHLSQRNKPLPGSFQIFLVAKQSLGEKEFFALPCKASPKRQEILELPCLQKLSLASHYAESQLEVKEVKRDGLFPQLP